MCSSWPTARVSRGAYTRDGGDPTKPRLSLEGTAENWPTPRTISGGAESAERKQALGRETSGGGDLQAAAELWATPNLPSGGRTLSDEETLAKGATANGKRQVDLQNQARVWASPPLGRQVLRATGPTSTPRSTLPSLQSWIVERLSGKSLGLSDIASAAPAAIAALADGVLEMSPEELLKRFGKGRLNPSFVEWLMGAPLGWTDYAPLGTESFRLWWLTHSVLCGED